MNHQHTDTNNDIRPAGPRRTQRRDAGQLRLGKRDLVGLCWCGEQGTMRLDQLAMLFAVVDQRPVSTDAARKTVGRWVEMGWAESRAILHGEPAFVWLTTAGMKQTALTYPSGPPGVATLTHQRQVTDLRLSIHATNPDARWRPERELRALLPARQAGATVPHLPDAEVMTPDGRTYAIELERTPKTVARTRGIIQGLLSRKNDYDHDAPPPPGTPHRYTGVLYYADEAAATVVREAVAQLDPASQQRVRVEVTTARPPA